MKNLKLRVHWFQERSNENDDNNGYHFGIYTFDCTEAEFDEEAGYGSYDILDAEWFKTEDERDNAWFGDVTEGDFMCTNCGGGFNRSEIVTDEDGDDYCNSCK